MSIPEAIKGAKAELASLRSPIDKIKRLGTYAKIIGAELLGTLTILPYGIRAHTLHRSLPDVRWEAGHQGVVSTARSVRYGPRERNIMDIYLPAEAEVTGNNPETSSSNQTESLQGNKDSSDQLANDSFRHPSSTTVGTAGNLHSGVNNGLPVVVFCHGGIWATGEKWHYAPFATRLAQAGVITAVIQYTLYGYPSALAPTMAEEVSQALTWTFDHIRSLGGDPENVTLAGHSAGAHLCAMALLHRTAGNANTNRNTSTAYKSENETSSSLISPLKLASSNNTNEKEAVLGNTASIIISNDRTTNVYDDGRMPRRFVGIAGVYDIAKHFQYEEGTR